MRFIHDYPAWRCPYCAKPVGYVGRAFAWFFGTRFHGCDFSNTLPDLPRTPTGGSNGR